MAREYERAGETWAKGRKVRGRQMRVNKVRGITIAYGKRLPIGGIKSVPGYMAYRRLHHTKPKATKMYLRYVKEVTKHDKAVAQAVNKVSVLCFFSERIVFCFSEVN